MGIPLWVTLAILQFFVLGIFTYYMVRHYAAKNSPTFSLIIVFLSWYLGFFGTLFLPIDIAEAYHSRLYQNVTNATDTNDTTISYTPTVTWSLSPLPSPSPSVIEDGDLFARVLREPSKEHLSSIPPIDYASHDYLSFTGSESAVPTAESDDSLPLSVASPATLTVTHTPLPLPSFQEIPADVKPALDPAPSPTYVYSRWDEDSADSAGSESGFADIGRLLQEEVEETPTPEPSPTNTSPFADWAIEVTQLRNGPLEITWFIVYALTFILSFIIIPVAQDYLIAGEFSHKGKLIYAVRTNMVFYAILGGVAFFALIYAVFGLGATVWDLFPIVISIANTYGLIIIVLLLGYGTAEVPLWFKRRANPEEELRRKYFRASDVMAVAEDSADELGDLLNDARKFGRSLMQLSQDKNFGDLPVVKEMVENMEIVKQRMREAIEILGPNHPAVKQDSNQVCQSNSRRPAREVEDDDDEDLGFARSLGPIASMFKRGDKYKGITPKKLASLHKQFNVCIAKVMRHRCRNEELLVRCLELEYVAQKKIPTVPRKCQTAEGRTFYVVPAGTLTSSNNPRAVTSVQQLPWGGRVPDGILREGEEVISERAAIALHSMMFMPTLFDGAINRFYWRTRIACGKYFCLFMWLFLEIFSIALLWSEVTIWVNLSGIVQENLSIFGIILRALDQREGDNYFSIQFASFVLLLYMCVCTTYTTFKLKLFDDMELSGNRNTHPYNFLSNSAFFNRLQFSLAFNFLNVCMHSTNKADFPDTAFLHSVGRRMALKKIDWYLPIIALIIYISCKFNFFYKALRKLGLEEKGDPQKGNREHETLIQQGRHIARLGQAKLGLNDKGMSQEHIEMQIELSKSRMDIILARMQARQEGRDPDEVAPDPFATLDDKSRLVPKSAAVDTAPIFADSNIATGEHTAVKVDETQAPSESGGTKKRGLMALAAKSTTTKASQMISSSRTVFGLKRENSSDPVDNAPESAVPATTAANQPKNSLFSMFGTGLVGFGTTTPMANPGNDMHSSSTANTFDANFGATLVTTSTPVVAEPTPYVRPANLADALRGVPRTSASSNASNQVPSGASGSIARSQDFGLGRPTIPSSRYPK